MKLTNDNVYGIYFGIQKVLADKTLKLPVRASYALLRDQALLAPIAEQVMKMRDEIVMSHATENEDGTWKINENEQDIVNQKITELQTIENDVELYMIDLNDLDNCELAISDIAAIMPIIREA